MKKLFVFLLAFMSATAFSSDYLSCNFKIEGNQTKWDLRKLKTSTSELNVELHPGINENHSLSIDRLIAHPGKKKTDKYMIRLFSDDFKAEEIAEDKNILTQRIEDSETIKVNVSDTGFGYEVFFRTNAGTYTMRVNGRGTSPKFNFFMYSKFSYLKKDEVKSKLSPIIISCQVMPESIISETEIKKGELLKREAAIKAGKTTSNVSRQ